ncbi:hypothetical protein [Parabacteroides sp.]
MRHSIVSFILMLLFSVSGDLYAADDFRERIYVQTDKQVYLAGELLWLKLCVTDATGIPVSFSKVGYVELLDESTALVQAKIEIKEGIGEGWLELPALLPTGYYRLVAYTRYMRNEGDAVFFRKTIGVVNTFRKDETIPTDTLIKATSPDISGNTLQLATDKTSFSRREQGNIRIQGLPADVHTLGISIAGNEFIPVPGDPSISQWQAALSALDQAALTDDYLPEYEGHLIRGKIVNVRTGEALAQTGVSPLLGFVGDEIRLFGGQLQDDKASVLFYTSRITGTHELATTANSKGTEVYRIDIQSPFALHPALEMPRFKMNPAWDEGLTRRNIGLQVTRTFTADSLGHVEPVHAHFQWRPYKTYLLDEYTRFPTMGEAVFEFVESVSFRNTNGKRSLFVLLEDLSNQTVSLNRPLVLLDGIPITDHELIYNYNPSLIRRLEVYRNRYGFGGQVFEGILAFYTYKNDYPTLKVGVSTQLFDYKGTQHHRLFYAPAYPDELSRKSRMPDYRHTLLWMPNVQTGGSPALTLPFYTSDLPGEYTVTVEGITKDGKTIRGIVCFQVIE